MGTEGTARSGAASTGHAQSGRHQAAHQGRRTDQGNRGEGRESRAEQEEQRGQQLTHVTLTCEWHGPMHYRPELRQWGPCSGFDGEGCTAGPVSDEAAARLAAGIKYWPGIIVNGEPWERARERLRTAREG